MKIIWAKHGDFVLQRIQKNSKGYRNYEDNFEENKNSYINEALDFHAVALNLRAEPA